MKPYFLWDYDLTETDVRQILHSGSASEKYWLIARILEHAHFRDIWRFLSLEDIVSVFTHLKLRSTTKQYWFRALTVWGYNV